MFNMYARNVGSNKVVLGTRRVHQGHGRKRRLIEKQDVMVYVPILKTLEVLLNDEGILAEVRHLHAHGDH